MSDEHQHQSRIATFTGRVSCLYCGADWPCPSERKRAAAVSPPQPATSSRFVGYRAGGVNG